MTINKKTEGKKSRRQSGLK